MDKTPSTNSPEYFFSLTINLHLLAGESARSRARELEGWIGRLRTLPRLREIARAAYAECLSKT